MITKLGLNGGSRTRKSAELLRDARALLAQMQRLHVASFDLGRAEQAGLADCLTEQTAFARNTIENADSVCAQIDRHLTMQKAPTK